MILVGALHPLADFGSSSANSQLDGLIGPTALRHLFPSDDRHLVLTARAFGLGDAYCLVKPNTPPHASPVRSSHSPRTARTWRRQPLAS